MTALASLSRFVESIGLSLEARSLHACLLRRGTLVWEARVDIPERGPFEVELRTLVASCPARRLARRRVRVLVHHRRVTTKVLPGVLASDFSEHSLAIIENPARYFVLPGDGVVVSDPWFSPSGDVWATAFRRTDVDCLTRVLGAHGWGNVVIAPAAAVLEDAGEAKARDTSALGSVDRLGLAEANLAYTAATTSAGLRMRVPIGLTVRRVKYLRGVANVAVFCLAALIGRTLSELRENSTMTALLRQDASASEAVVAMADSLAAISLELDRLRVFAASHPSVLIRLAAVAELLEPIGTIDRLTMQDSSAELSLLVQDGVATPAVFASLEWVQDARLVGSVVRETPPSDLERITLRLRFAPVRSAPLTQPANPALPASDASRNAK